MTASLLLLPLVLVLIAALAPRYGADSRGFGAAQYRTTPLRDVRTAWGWLRS